MPGKGYDDCLSYLLLLFIGGCTFPPDDPPPASETPVGLAQVKSDIQAAENAWAAALNARDLDALMALYADDAVSMTNNAPMLAGKDAIRKNQEQEFASTPEGLNFTFEVLDIYGDGNTVTETGASTYKNADGEVVGTGKYMCVWKKQDGKYLCVREIYNGDSPSVPKDKSIHLFDLPADVAEADWAAALAETNGVIAELGYPGAGYFSIKRKMPAQRTTTTILKAFGPALMLTRKSTMRRPLKP